jgi:hypothetical protein
MEKYGPLACAFQLRHYGLLILLAAGCTGVFFSCETNTTTPVNKRLFAVEGIVQDTGHKPIQGAVAAIVKGTSSWPEIAAITDENGRFSLSGLERGTYSIQIIFSEQQSEQEVVLHDSDTTLQITLNQ